MSAALPVLVGPTAAGKSALALALAERVGAEIVSLDSMQVYRGMDIGTAKPSAAEQLRVTHHLIDMVDCDGEWTVVEHQRAAQALVDRARDQDRPDLVLVGGTGLYVHALVDAWTFPGQYPELAAELEAHDTADLHQRLIELDPVAAARMEPTNRRRVVRALEVTLGSGRPFSSFGPGVDGFAATERYQLIGLDLPRPVLDERIERRFMAQLDAGFLDEVAALAPRMGRTAGQALGYKELLAHLEGTASLDAAIDTALRRIRRFARRQQRWFRRDPRIRWLTYERDPTELVAELAPR